MKKLGIIGGMGPLAGVDLATKLIEQCNGVCDQDHVPFVLASVPSDTTCRSSFLAGDISISPAKGIVSALAQLAASGVDIVGIPCNTSHAAPIFDDVKAQLDQKELPLQLLHIVDEVVKHLKQYHPDIHRVGVLGTIGTQRSQLYQAILQSAGYDAVELPEQQLLQLHDAIHDPNYGIKSIALPPTDKAVNTVEKAIEQLYQQGAQVIILACSELPIAIKYKRYKDVYIVDATLVLARAMLAQVAIKKLKPWHPE